MKTFTYILSRLVGKNVGRLITATDESGKTIRGRRKLRYYFRAGGALLARGKYVPPSERHICFGEHGCKCWKHYHNWQTRVTS